MRKDDAQTLKTNRVVIACHIMEPEIEALQPAENNVEVRYLNQSLHRTPQNMPGLVQEQVDEVENYASQIVLGYGLCSNGIVGVTAPKQGLIVPRVHDCIALFLGSRAAYDQTFHERPGTYYLTPGWVAEKKDPLGCMEDDYVPRVGRKNAEWALREEYKNYTHIALIDTKVEDLAPLRTRALENARFLDMQYEEVSGTQDYFEKILFGPYQEEDFLIFQPGETVSQNPFLY